MSSDFNAIKTLIQGGKIKSRTKIINNFFDVGTRGYYENPFTEVLSYLIGHRSQYSNRHQFLKLFLESLPNLPTQVIDSFLLELNIDTQRATNNKNFIDLILFNGKYAIVFENKIEHWLANPLEDYINDTSSRFSNLTSFFYVLSYYPTQTPEKWTNVLIGYTFSFIKQRLAATFTNKWDYFVDDFLTHYLPSNDITMKDEEFDFYSKNFSTVFAANNNVNDFIDAVVNKVKTRLPTETKLRVSIVTNFGDKVTRSARLYPNSSEDNVVLVFKAGNKISINIYYYKKPSEHLDNLITIVGSDNYTNWTEGSVSCFKRHVNREFTNIEEAIEECCNQIVRMTQYYG